MKPLTRFKPLLCLAIVSATGLCACSTTNQRHVWRLFYDDEASDPALLSIFREPQPLDFYTNGIPGWNTAFHVTPATITVADLTTLGEIDGLRVVEVRLALSDIYYTDAMMIMEEVKPGRFLPVYVQDYNRDSRHPSDSICAKDGGRVVINTSMDYEGTGHFHNRYEITLSPNRDPVVVRSFY